MVSLEKLFRLSLFYVCGKILVKMKVFSKQINYWTKTGAAKLFFMTYFNCLVLTVSLLKNLTFGCKTNILLFSTDFDRKTLYNPFVLVLQQDFSRKEGIFSKQITFWTETGFAKLFFPDILKLSCFEHQFAQKKKTLLAA